MYKVLVTGSRNLTNPRMLINALSFELEYAESKGEQLLLIHGACPTGADKIADDWALEMVRRGHGVFIDRHPANWNKYGAAAGPYRNKDMVDLKPDIVLAYPIGESRGTRGTMKMALEAGLTVKQLGE